MHFKLIYSYIAIVTGVCLIYTKLLITVPDPLQSIASHALS